MISRAFELAARGALAWRRFQNNRRITSDGMRGARVDFEGLKVFLYRKETGKPPLFLLHGFLDSSRTFRRLFSPLSQHFDVYAVDIPGFGESRLPAIRELWRIDSIARITGRFLLHILRERAVRFGDMPAQIVTHSMGGLIALHAVYDLTDEKFEQHFARMHLISPGMLRFHPEERDAHRRRFYPRSVEEIRALMAELFHEARPDLPEFLLRGILSLWGHEGYEFLAENTIQEEHHIFFDPKSRLKLKPDVFLYWGKEDRIVSIEYGRMVEKTLGSKLAVIEGAGHCPQVEQPAALTELILKNALADIRRKRARR